MAVIVSDGTLAGVELDASLVTTLGPEPQCEEAPADPVSADVVVEEEGEKQVVCEESLIPEVVSSVLEEAGGDQVDGSSKGEVHDQELEVQNIVSDVPRTKLAEATKGNYTLNMAKALADTQSEGYYWQECLLFRTRLDRLGDTREQLCLPKDYRHKCLRMAHEHFGHMGRNKMGDNIRQFFYWPTIMVDLLTHTKSCPKCQKLDKTLPLSMIMLEREVVSIPSDRVAIDHVGPFPTAKGGGGVKYLLTYMTWPPGGRNPSLSEKRQTEY